MWYMVVHERAGHAHHGWGAGFMGMNLASRADDSSYLVMISLVSLYKPHSIAIGVSKMPMTVPSTLAVTIA
jgi:hypothetical protein